MLGQGQEIVLVRIAQGSGLRLANFICDSCGGTGRASRPVGVLQVVNDGGKTVVLGSAYVPQRDISADKLKDVRQSWCSMGRQADVFVGAKLAEKTGWPVAMLFEQTLLGSKTRVVVFADGTTLPQGHLSEGIMGKEFWVSVGCVMASRNNWPEAEKAFWQTNQSCSA